MICRSCNVNLRPDRGQRPVFDGMLDYGGHLVVDALLVAMVNMDARRKGIFTALAPLTLSQASRGLRNYGAPSTVPWTRYRMIIEERRVSPRPDFISDCQCSRRRRQAQRPGIV